MADELRVGPILGFRAASSGTWSVSLLWVRGAAQPAPVPTFGGAPATIVRTVRIATGPNGEAVWRVDVDVTRPAAGELRVDYAADGASHAFRVPAPGSKLQLAFASCNGFSDDTDKHTLQRHAARNARWQRLVELHRGERPAHLLLLGGDQLYGDSLWHLDESSWLRDWLALAEADKGALVPSAAQRAQLDAFYFALYCKRWSQEHVADALAEIPTLMMWDDHDIFDGFGSHGAAIQSSQVFAAIFAAAERAFRTFQLQLEPGAAPAGAIPGGLLSWAQRVDDLAIVALDLRSERAPQQVMGAAAFEAVLAAIGALGAQQPRHLLVISGPPVAFPSAAAVEWIVKELIPGEQDVEDDLRDRWGSKAHVGERRKLVRRLLAVAIENGVRVTLLSGDVHMAALGLFRAKGATAPRHPGRIYNLVSSPIVHSPPPRVALWALKLLREQLDVADDVKAEMIEIPGAKHLYVARRNFLLLRERDDGGLVAAWYFEDPDGKPRPERVRELAIDPV